MFSSRKYWIVSFVIPLVLVLSFLVFELIAEIKKTQAGEGTSSGPLENHTSVWTEDHRCKKILDHGELLGILVLSHRVCGFVYFCVFRNALHIMNRKLYRQGSDWKAGKCSEVWVKEDS